MKKSDVSGEENSKEDMPSVPVPKFTLIQQSDENGTQITAPRSSWFASLCNCFKAIDTNYSTPKDQALLEAQNVTDYGKNTLVLDLDETLVHSSFSGPKFDLSIDITVDRQKFKIFVLKRPGLEEFLQKCYDLYEVVIFTASLSVYADPLLDILDPHGKIAFRLFRESCSFANGTYVKDLSRLGRDLKKVVIVDVMDS
jgi:Dullard-like phosphatase family protein